MPDDLKVPMEQQDAQPEAQENKIPKEFEFLNDAKVRDQLAKVKSEGEYNDDEVRLMMAAQAVGDQIGHENLNDEVMKSLAEYMKQLGLITEIPQMKGKPEESQEGETPKEQAAPAPEEEQEAPQEGAPQEAPPEEAPVEGEEQEAPQENSPEGQEEAYGAPQSEDEEQEQPQEDSKEERVIRRAMKIIETLLRGE